MFRNLRAVWAEIDLDNLEHNIHQIKNICKSKEIIGVVKANAYGHGAVDVVPTLIKNDINYFAVAVLSEAIELRDSGIKSPIMILGHTPPELGDIILDNDIEQTVYSYDVAYKLSQLAKLKNKILNIHIALDTGMGRIGFLPTDESIEEIIKISKLPNINIKGMFSHFSSADENNKEYTILQFEKFKTFESKLKHKGINIHLKHIANSAAIIDMKDVWLDAVRAGIILYGYYPSNEINKNDLDLKPVLSIKTSIVHLKKIPKGEYISYGRTFKTEKESVIATLPVGYADGYNRLLSNKGKAIINGKFAPIIGRVCMDQCMIDVSDIENIKTGDTVILLGEEGKVKYTAEEMAKDLNTISYEVISNLDKRIPRLYIKNGEIVNLRNYK